MVATLFVVVEACRNHQVQRFRSSVPLSGAVLASFDAPLNHQLLEEHPVEALIWHELGAAGRAIVASALGLGGVTRVHLTPHTLYVMAREGTDWGELITAVGEVLEESLAVERTELTISDAVADEFSDVLAVLDLASAVSIEAATEDAGN